jgi:hypothetical protein
VADEIVAKAGGQQISGKASTELYCCLPTTEQRAAVIPPIVPERSDQPGDSSSLRMTLPAGLRGILFTILMSRGCSNRDTLPFRYSRMDSS